MDDSATPIPRIQIWDEIVIRRDDNDRWLAYFPNTPAHTEGGTPADALANLLNEVIPLWLEDEDVYPWKDTHSCQT